MPVLQLPHRWVVGWTVPIHDVRQLRGGRSDFRGIGRDDRASSASSAEGVERIYAATASVEARRNMRTRSVGRMREIRDAEQQCEDEAWQCKTCSAPSQEHGVYCRPCEMYWQDCDAGLFDDEHQARLCVPLMD